MVITWAQNATLSNAMITPGCTAQLQNTTMRKMVDHVNPYVDFLSDRQSVDVYLTQEKPWILG